MSITSIKKRYIFFVIVCLVVLLCGWIGIFLSHFPEKKSSVPSHANASPSSESDQKQIDQELNQLDKDLQKVNADTFNENSP